MTNEEQFAQTTSPNLLPRGEGEPDNASLENLKWQRTPADIEPSVPQDTPPTSSHKSGGLPLLVQIFTVIGALFTVIAVGISAWQLFDINTGEKTNRALSVVQHFLTSTEIKDISDKIADKTEKGKNYEHALNDDDLQKEITHYLNALEFIAYGVNKSIYDESVVYFNLAEIIYKHSTAHLYGKSGTLPSGEHWFSNSKNKPLFGSISDYPELRILYKKWFPNGEYSDKLP